MKKLFLIFTIIFLLGNNVYHAQTSTQIENLKAFAKVYGYVKYFHPSDEAFNLDWNRFSTFGSIEVLNCKNTDELIKSLRNLFQPISPGIIISKKENKYNFDEITPKEKNDFNEVYWQHEGVSFGMSTGNFPTPYKSNRVNGFSKKDNGSSSGNLVRSFNIKDFKGKKVKYTAWVKLTDETEGSVHIWFRVDKKDKTPEFFNNVNTTVLGSWQKLEIESEIVTEDADNLSIGCYLNGQGSLFVDNVKIQIKQGDSDLWRDYPFNNNSFDEESLNTINEGSGWRGKSKGYEYSLSNKEFIDGKRSALIKHVGDFEIIKGESLFDSKPNFGDLITNKILDSIYVQIPVVLFGNKQGTFPKANSFEELRKKLKNVSQDSKMLPVRLGNIINTYNVFQHFYPYFDEVKVDWDVELERYLKKSFNDYNENDHLITLEKFTSALNDGHISIYGNSTNFYVPPIRWDWIQEKLVITKVLDSSLNIKVGDIVEKVNGVNYKEFFDEVKSRISAGTSGRKNYVAKQKSLFAEKDKVLNIEIAGFTHVLKHDNQFKPSNEPLEIEIQNHDYKVLDNNIIYLNMSSIKMDTIQKIMPGIRASKGIICDLRGYPAYNKSFISHLLREEDSSFKWMEIPRHIYPNQNSELKPRYSYWNLKPLKPYLGDKKVIFMTDGRAISFAESYLSFISHYKLATIIGQPTAGTNGNINMLTLSGGFRMIWTGMKVLKHNGNQLHGIGILPDVYVERTIEGLKAGKDEYLEKAIQLINQT